MFAFTISIAIVAMSALIFGVVLFRQRPVAGQTLRTSRNGSSTRSFQSSDSNVGVATLARDLRPTHWQQTRSGIMFIMSIIGIGGLIGALLAGVIVITVFILI